MSRRLGRALCLAVTMLLVVPALAPAQPADNAAPETGVAPQREQAAALLKTAQGLIAAARFEEAERNLQNARGLDADYPAVYSNLGYLYEAWQK